MNKQRGGASGPDRERRRRGASELIACQLAGEAAGPAAVNERQAGRRCDDCGAEQEQELQVFGGWVGLWVWLPHDCEAGRLRRSREAEAAARESVRLREEQERAWRWPTPEQALRVRRSVGLPRWIAGGLEWLPAERVSPAALGRLLQDRAVWLAGGRPEKGVWLYGATGLWKTTALGALLFDLRNRLGLPCLWWNLERLREELRLHAAGRASAWDPGAVRRAVVLGLDDLTRQRMNDTGMELLYGMVNAAYDGYAGDDCGQWLYVSSNEDPDGVLRVLRKVDPDGAAPVVRRLVKLCEVIDVGRPAG